MQINGIGTGHSSSDHHVTDCLHEHSAGRKTGGAAAMGGLTDTVTLSQQSAAAQPEGQFSLSAWLDKTLNNGKKLWQGFWGSERSAAANGNGGQSLAEQALAMSEAENNASGALLHGQQTGEVRGHSGYGIRSEQVHTLHAPQAAAAATAVQAEQDHVLQQNAYFEAVETGGRKETLWQKMKVKFRDVAGQMSGHLPGRFTSFQAKSSFQMKQEAPKEDLRKRSKYRQDELEIDCVLTDDSYLQDSYNRRGEYSRLAGDMRGSMVARK